MAMLMITMAKEGIGDWNHRIGSSSWRDDDDRIIRIETKFLFRALSLTSFILSFRSAFHLEDKSKIKSVHATDNMRQQPSIMMHHNHET
jgi:hypothetical protein